jgi:DNA-binding NarL/FixJ family response regulator
MNRDRSELALVGRSGAKSTQAKSAIAVAKVEKAKHSVFLADDQEEVLRAVAMTLQDEYQIVGLAINGKDLLEVVPALQPEILVLDVFMPLINGIEAAFRLKAVGCCSKVIFLTVHDDSDFVEAALATGARGYVLKPRLATDLIPAIESALDNGFFLSPGLQGEGKRLSA